MHICPLFLGLRSIPPHPTPISHHRAPSRAPWAIQWLPTSYLFYIPVHFSSVAQSCPTLCNPMDHSTPGLPVYHQLPEFTQTHVHRVSDAIQPSHPPSSPSPPAFSLSQHQGLTNARCSFKKGSVCAFSWEESDFSETGHSKGLTWPPFRHRNQELLVLGFLLPGNTPTLEILLGLQDKPESRNKKQLLPQAPDKALTPGNSPWGC